MLFSFKTAGYFLGYVFYMALESYNILTLSDFLYFWGIVFMVATTLVAIFKHEDIVKEKVDYDDEDAEGEEILGVVDTYKQLVKLLTPMILLNQMSVRRTYLRKLS